MPRETKQVMTVMQQTECKTTGSWVVGGTKDHISCLEGAPPVLPDAPIFHKPKCGPLDKIPQSLNAGNMS